ncbi:MAG TPA: HlyD family efflux transporter periplasmic adaptor subunit [Candidatus Udaeobacter sp.]|nr:HlyD family efflux transporter periplasmic adaptor subunit [Candidatus Udaeobacter sp.]
MDRALDNTYRRRQRLRRLALPIAGVGGLILLLAALPGWVRPTVHRARLRTAVVDRGPIDATLTASGVVIPEYEHILSSPLDTRVTRILKHAGDAVSAGDSLVVLDLGEPRLAVERLADQIAIKENQQSAEALDLRSKLEALAVQVDIQSLELKSAEYALAKNRTLFEKGLTTGDAVRQAETDVERKRFELADLEGTKRHAEEASRLRMAGLALEQRVLAKEREEAHHSVELGAAVAPRAGVVTWVVPSEGVAVRRGDEIARIADLRSFRVQATISDVHVGRLAAGSPVVVEAGDAKLQGRVSQVLPAIENGTLSFLVSLEESSNPQLRPNLRVDVQVATAHKDDVLRIARGTFPNLDGRPVAFVLRDGRALRRPVELGVQSFDCCEVVTGLEIGDEVVISDMTDYAHLAEVEVR